MTTLHLSLPNLQRVDVDIHAITWLLAVHFPSQFGIYYDDPAAARLNEYKEVTELC